MQVTVSLTILAKAALRVANGPGTGIDALATAIQSSSATLPLTQMLPLLYQQ